MKIKSSVFWRGPRDKKTNRVDGEGNPVLTKIKGSYVARLRYYDNNGQLCSVERSFMRKCDAIDARDRLIEEIKQSHGEIRNGERMTFKQIADVCEREFYQPAVIVEGRKIAGVRSVASAKSQLNSLRSFFGNALIKEITTESLTAYKVHRMRPRKQSVRPVKLATVNRELATLRKILRFALRKGWIVRDIFLYARAIDAANEVERNRVLTLAEEVRLLACCQGARTIKYSRKVRGRIDDINSTVSVDNPYLKAMIIIALDSGLRRGEILKLKWDDIDYDNDFIRVVGSNTKTERERLAPLTERGKAELKKLETLTPDRPFPFIDIKRSFNTAKRLAGIDDLRFHDLRRTAITRWQQKGVPLAIAGKLAGHSQLQTTMKHYTAGDLCSVKDVVARLNEADYAQPTAIQISEQLN